MHMIFFPTFATDPENAKIYNVTMSFQFYYKNWVSRFCLFHKSTRSFKKREDDIR